MTDKTLTVFVSECRAGSLHQTHEGRVWWEPDMSWLSNKQHPVLGLNFLRQPGRQSVGMGLPAWFENLLPEVNSALRRRVASESGVREGNSFSLLRVLGEDLPGAVVISATANEPSREERRPTSNSPSDDERLTLRFSLAGMQLKLSMRSAGERMTLPARGETARWIVKLPGVEYPDLPQIEEATMQWARASGLHVPSHFIVSTNKLVGLPTGWGAGCTEAFAIERFDRTGDGGRIHHEDFCQALNIFPRGKYGEIKAHHIHFDGVLRLVVDTCGDAEGRRFARRLGFVLASGNDDAHLKNWSFAWGTATQPVLSPCYDQVCTIAWPGFGWDQKSGPTLPLKLGRAKYFQSLTTDALSRLTNASDCPWAGEELENGIEAATKAWPGIANLAPSRMREALTTHWEQTPLLRRFKRR